MSQISQSSDIFSGYAQGLQCISNSIISLIYHVNKNCELWTLEDIENILRSGNILYKSIGKKTTLLVSDVPQYIKLYNFIYHISEQNSVIGDIFKEDINFNTVPFKKVEPIIVTHKVCVLVIGECAVSIIHSNNNFHVFDPHNRNKYGLPDINGGSIVLKFKNFNSLLMYIDRLSQSLNTTLYELTPIKITKFKMMQPNRNINRNLKTTKTDNSCTQKKNLPAGKSKYNTQSSDNNSKQVNCTDNNNFTTSNTLTANTSKMQTRKRQSENNNAINEQHKKNKVQNDDTKAKEINCTTKRKLPTQTISGNTKKQKIHDMKKLIKPKHNIKKLFIKVPNILFSLHREQNKKKLTKAKQDNILCKQYGYNFKIPLIHLKNITPKNTNKKTTNSNISNTVNYKYGRNFDESIKIFNELTSHGPIYVCSICQQTNFIDKVTEIAKLHKTKNSNLLNECSTNYKSINNKEYICYMCQKYIYKGKIPKLSIKNGCSFPKKPNELDLFNLEERFISPVMAFMLIHQLFPGGQFSLYGSIRHLPIEIGKVINTLP